MPFAKLKGNIPPAARGDAKWRETRVVLNLEREGVGGFESMMRMDVMRKKLGWRVIGRLSRMSRSTITIMTQDSTAFLVSIKVRLDGRVCNALLIFIAPPSPSPFYPSGYFAAKLSVPFSSSALSLLRLLITFLFPVIIPVGGAKPR